ncbi:PREDICTED: serine/threonine-protein phosphatase 2A 55 kDa regulatory subunit B alpha isoform isoform X2 [Papilio polytes]|uniref:serine/threonine-protein phosphatase 2A 55 kDa regulatory subunit B alpha isoform isoform X2 n=1 Tax=Papilio polytes TaxID=76194 RepID=UPI0006767D50|nr:PREDICTED: serine/threonine-protein phosphatase 2A 55 kDa regulatory subunit B alpha isoform isoform X2 [Papilio polytes]
MCCDMLKRKESWYVSHRVRGHVADWRSNNCKQHWNTACDCNGGETTWCFSQVKGTLEDDVTEADLISCVEFNHDGELLATGDKGGRVVIFQRDPASKQCVPKKGEYNVYSTFQSHEPEFDYLKSLEIEEKINKIRWLKRKNQAHFLLSTNDKTIKLWKVSERDKRVTGYNTREEGGRLRHPSRVTQLRVPTVRPAELMVEASPRRIFANAHTYHINSISLNSDQETYLSADDLRINLWHLEITDQSFNIVDIKPANMEELTEVITAAEFHPTECNLFVYSSSKGTIRLCDMRAAALCDRHAKLFEEPEDPHARSFFSEIISSISDVKLSNSGRYMMSRDYLGLKVWDLRMETKPVETYPVHEYLRSKLCSLYENDCIFDKFECCWSGDDQRLMTGSYNGFFRIFERGGAGGAGAGAGAGGAARRGELTLEASRDAAARPRQPLRARRVAATAKRKKDEISVDCLDFNKKILHTAWHPHESVIAVAATNNLFIFQDKF